MTGRPAGRPLVPAYLSTGGVARPSRPQLERLSVLTRGDAPVPAGLPAAALALLDVLEGGALALVEAAALLRLPVSAVRVLAADLADRDLLLARAPIPPADRFAPDLLKRVADGLRALKH
ncbi:DUF742 domain-containing protein [Streptomyces longwoodensis]|uniref:DUF742 domain-containing protein n=1 Tax=Streptomyces lasalocidi TaxID=324833 RepID=A0A4U5WD74_STRLS|nr:MULTISPECIES: DUF742 domain-containing protein [Streptomyces]MCX5000115.1 DUF742 domain-containing protein [Streptomyces longwoodensis]TKS99161.1 DUF742 domain-containing protein [Streptomyces lasalocidi]WTI48831.1 DUF742 domain-containing protein [Streptomyces longwoodensis]WUC61529.1 DUF742 domain-containing protein [Streptomyces longwoodensis]WUC75102.1 DUF742 domain-containing protein [Streptomyces longwoodensis]